MRRGFVRSPKEGTSVSLPQRGRWILRSKRRMRRAVRRTSISAYSRTAHAYNKYIRALWAHNYFTIPLATLSSKNALILPVFCRTFPILKYKFVGSFCAFCTIPSQDPANRLKTTKFRHVFAARSTPFQNGAAATHPLTAPASAPRFARSDPITAPHRASRRHDRHPKRIPPLFLRRGHNPPPAPQELPSSVSLRLLALAGSHSNARADASATLSIPIPP